MAAKGHQVHKIVLKYINCLEIVTNITYSKRADVGISMHFQYLNDSVGAQRRYCAL